MGFGSEIVDVLATSVIPDRGGADMLAAAPRWPQVPGCACHAGTHTPSTIVLALGIDPTTALGAIRLTLDRTTTEHHIATGALSLAAAAAPAGLCRTTAEASRAAASGRCGVVPEATVRG